MFVFTPAEPKAQGKGVPLILLLSSAGCFWGAQARTLALRERSPCCPACSSGFSPQICLHSCFQKAMVDSCGCAQYAQPLPAGAEYCNYKKNPNWSKCPTPPHRPRQRIPAQPAQPCPHPEPTAEPPATAEPEAASAAHTDSFLTLVLIACHLCTPQKYRVVDSTG